MAHKLSYSPAQCPVDVETLRRHANVDDKTDDDLLEARGVAATELVEQHLGRLLLSRPVVWTVSAHARGAHPLSGPAFGGHTLHRGLSFPSSPRGWVELPRPASGVTSVKLLYWDGTDATLAEGLDYQADCDSEPSRLRLLAPAFGVGVNPQHLQVAFTAGYGPAAADVPKPILFAIQLLVTNLTENRGDQEFNIWTSAVDSLLAPYRVECFA